MGTNKKIMNKNTMRDCKKIICAYSVFFVLGMVICLFWVWAGKDSFSSNGDEIRQNYLSLVYIGKWLRSIIRESISQHKLVIPMFEWALGYGADIIKTLSYYGIGDPFYWLSALCPQKYAEYFYWFLFIFRAYGRGLSFLYYSRIKNKLGGGIGCHSGLCIFYE